MELQKEVVAAIKGYWLSGAKIEQIMKLTGLTYQEVYRHWERFELEKKQKAHGRKL